MRIHDITVTLSENMPTMPLVPAPAFRPIRRIAAGDVANAMLLSLCSHTGTHVDAPYHFEEDGLRMEALPLTTLMGRARVVEMVVEGNITADHLDKAGLSPGLERVLFKTRNSQFWPSDAFRPDYCGLTPEAARWLAERGLKLVGVDYLSVEPGGSKDYATHHTLLGKGIILLEGVDLSRVRPGDYTLICLPLPVQGGDGSPARAVLIEPPFPSL